MRFLTAAATALVLIFCSTGVTHRAVTSPAPAATHVVLAGAAGGRAVGGPATEPQFFGGWWKTFKKIMIVIFDFIDGLIDATLPGDGKEGGGEGGGGGGSAQVIPLMPAHRLHPLTA